MYCVPLVLMDLISSPCKTPPAYRNAQAATPAARDPKRQCMHVLKSGTPHVRCREQRGSLLSSSFLAPRPSEDNRPRVIKEIISLEEARNKKALISQLPARTHARATTPTHLLSGSGSGSGCGGSWGAQSRRRWRRSSSSPCRRSCRCTRGGRASSACAQRGRRGRRP